MSSTDDSSLNSSPPFENKPWAWIVLPVVLVFAVGTLAVVLHMRRTKRQRARLAALDPRARAALEHDLDLAWPVSDATASRTYVVRGVGIGSAGAGSARWVRPANRWAWASSFAAAPRVEEGLNELGEAPPPYMGGPGLKAEGDGVELDDLRGEEHQRGRGSTSSAGAVQPVTGADAPRGVGGISAPLPPAYTDGERPMADMGVGVSPEIAAPAPAALPPRRISQRDG